MIEPVLFSLTDLLFSTYASSQTVFLINTYQDDSFNPANSKSNYSEVSNIISEAKPDYMASYDDPSCLYFF